MKTAISLVIPDGHFYLPHRFLWVCIIYIHLINPEGRKIVCISQVVSISRCIFSMLYDYTEKHLLYSYDCYELNAAKCSGD